MTNRYGNTAMLLLEKGLQPIPIKTQSKKPIHVAWTTMELNKETVGAMAANGYASAGVGIRCGNGNIAIDADIRHPEASRRVLEYLNFNFNFSGSNLPYRIGAAPKFLIAFTSADINQKITSTKYIDTNGNLNCIEVLASGQQYIAYGIHEDLGTEYTWHNGDPANVFFDIPEINADQLQDLFAFFDELADDFLWKKVKKSRSKKVVVFDENNPFAEVRPTFEEVKETLFLINVKDFDDDRDGWVDIAMAVNWSTKGSEEGFMLFDQWSSGGEKYGETENDTRRLWDSINNDEDKALITFRTLCDLASSNISNTSNISNASNISNNSNDNNIAEQTSNELITNSKTDITNITSRNNSVKFEVISFIGESEDEFSIQQIYQTLGVRNRVVMGAIRKAVHDLKKEGEIEAIPNKRGSYRPVVSDLEDMDLHQEEQPSIPIDLPLGLSNYVKVLPGSVLLFYGSTNSGKTSLFLSILRDFCKKFVTKNEVTPLINTFSTPLNKKIEGWNSDFGEIRYLNSEMSNVELSNRIGDLGDDIAPIVRQVTRFIKRPRDWSRAIDPNGLNFVDYIQIYDDFHIIGQHVNDIHEQLENGLAFVTIQKKTGEPFPRGGEFALEKARLAVAMESNTPYGTIATIKKLKHPVDYKKNIQGMEIDFIIDECVNIIPKNTWRFVNKYQRKTMNERYAKDNMEEKFSVF